MRGVALAFALLLALPTAMAHIPHNRDSVQSIENARAVIAKLNGTVANVDMLDTLDRTRNLVTYDIAPGRMAIDAEVRQDAPIADRNVLHARFELARIVLFHDINQDGAFEPATDGVLKSWRFSNYQWRATDVRLVGLGTLTGVNDVLWNGTLGGAPNVTLEMAAPGRDVTDEGARARPQDLILYLTVPNLPARPAGSLYAIEGALVTAPGAAVAEERLDNTTLAVHADVEGRRAYLDWGGSVQNERGEGNLTFAMDPPDTVGGQTTRPMRWTLPLTDKGFRIVLVAAVEYTLPNARGTPDAALPLAAGAIALVALARRRSV